MPSAGRMRPNTVSAGSCTTPRQSPVRTITLSRTLVNSPKKPFQSPGTQNRDSHLRWSSAFMFPPFAELLRS